MANIGQKWLEILIPFSYDYNVRLTASEISRKIKIPLRTVSRTLNNLVEINLLKYEVEGKNKKYYFNLDDPKACSLMTGVESIKSLKFSFDDFFINLRDVVKLREVVLFGSYVKGYATEESDIDVLVLGKRSKKIERFAKKDELNIHFSTIKKFENLLKERNPLALEIIENHVVFGGLEFLGLCWRYYYG